MAHKFTVATQLHERNNADLIAYLDGSFEAYNRALRETFYTLKHDKNYNKSSYNTYLQNKYDITKRSANSIITDAQGRLNALAELKKYELKQIEHKVSHFESVIIPKLEAQRNAISEQLRSNSNDVDLVQRQKNLRRKIVSKKSRLNRLKQQSENLKHEIDTGNYRLCFGTKALLKQDVRLFRQKRDSHLKYVGAATESACNQMFQMAYNKFNNQFEIRLRKDYGGFKNNKQDKYVTGKCYFRQYKNELRNILVEHSSPLTYEIIKRNGRYYLYCTFELPDRKVTTHNEFGTIGIDFNKGFLAVSEVNDYGHLTDTDIFKYRFRQGSATKTDLEKIAVDLCGYALHTGKDLVIEDLNFSKKKGKTETRQGKKYNEMIHSLAYKEYAQIMETAAFKYGVRLRKVNPAWTSWLGKKLYCDTMKLNIHTAASFVIARRGMGIQEKEVA